MNTDILDDLSGVRGHIYVICNKVNNKKYVGQAVTHRKNKGKYRPFGFEGRFRDHISEALCNTKKKQCRYLNNAIRLHGKDVFEVSLILECERDELDMYEQQYIEQLCTMYPNGYNLTKGGRTIGVKTGDDISPLELNQPAKKWGGCKERSAVTRERISSQLKKAFGTEEVKRDLMARTQKQHADQKAERFIGKQIDLEHLEQYIRIKHAKGIPFVVVNVDDATTSFVGKYETLDALKERAFMFLKQVYAATLSNCSGNP
jgi:group I intron endonuclease